MDWIQTLSIMATVVMSAYYIHVQVQSDMRAQSARTDKLYEMFLEAQKEFHQRIEKIDDKFYDLLKDKK